MPHGVGLSFPRMSEKRAKYVEAVKHELTFPPLRWTRDRFVPWVVERLNNKNSASPRE